jgi:N6-adenosine-specific RNA methylase IME4
MIEAVSSAPRIEIFAREEFDGWDAFGNELPHIDTEVHQ